MAFVGEMFFERGDGAIPEVFDRICQVFSIGGLGETNELVDATTFCSGGNREYIGGLADGAELTIECNYEKDNVDLSALISDVKAKTTGNYKVVVENGSPAESFQFAAVALSWTLNPSIDDRNTITFTFKISGEITIV